MLTQTSAGLFIIMAYFDSLRISESGKKSELIAGICGAQVTIYSRMC